MGCFHGRSSVIGCYFDRLHKKLCSLGECGASVYRRLAPGRGHKRAIVAVAHRLLIAVYHMLKQHQPYRDYRASDTGERSQEQRLKRLQQQVERLGY